MSEAVTENPSPRGRHQIKAKLQRLRASRRHEMFGMAEILGLCVSAVIVLTVIISYVYFLVPARSRRQSLELERSRLQTQVRNSQQIMLQGHDTQSTVDRITASLEGFESDRLPSPDQGRMGLYGELNQLIRKNTLRNTSGPSYTPLVSSNSKPSATGARSTSTKWQSVYPGIGVSLTVEGPYSNLRHFVRDLEASKQFIIINGIELERATETNTASPVEGVSAGAAGGSRVSLRLDMATYFQLDAPEEAAPEGVRH